ncbi:sentan-like [Amia ocellicauda]|uniref:sentan-like n=1 Tax=Amia ocellicauda TaxID=2972642 RepID=UPI003464A2B5
MCGSVSSSAKARQSQEKKRVNSDKEGTRLTSQKMPKSVPVSKQLASVKALGKGTDLEKSIGIAALVFYNSAGPDGKLSKREAKDLLLTQFQTFIQGQEAKPKYKEIFADLDEEKERKICFEDFMVLVISLSVMSDVLEDIQKARI